MSMHGKVVVVTGASSGIGEAIAHAVAREGATVALLARTKDALSRTASKIAEAGGSATAYPVDLADHQAVTEVAERIVAGLGTPHVLVNNAGSGRFLFLDETSHDEFEAQQRLPYFAAFHLTRELLPVMLGRGDGYILTVNSPASRIPWPGAAGYAMSRWALRGMVEVLRAELAGTGIAVGELVAGKVATPYFDANPGSEDRIPAVSRIVRTLTPEQVADAAVRAIRRRSRDVVIPHELTMLTALARITPSVVRAAQVRTGARRGSRH